MIVEARACAGWDSRKGPFEAQMNTCGQMCPEGSKDGSKAAIRTKHQVSVIMQFGRGRCLTFNVARINEPSSTGNDSRRWGHGRQHARHSSNPLPIQVRGGGLMFAFTRSRRSSLVAFLSGSSPLFEPTTISFCTVKIAKTD